MNVSGDNQGSAEAAAQEPALSAVERNLVASILDMYRAGWFPMGDPDTGRIDWVQPRRRGVIPLDPGAFRVPRSLAQRVRSGRFEIRIDTAFGDVIRACAQPRSYEEKTWILKPIVDAYCLLHRAGHAHSVEAWLVDQDARSGSAGGPDVLVGGLYGVHIGAAFFGESMFSRPDLGGTDASKVCLVHLVERLRAAGFLLLDAQLYNDHLGQFGCVEVNAAKFAPLLAAAVSQSRAWTR